MRHAALAGLLVIVALAIPNGHAAPAKAPPPTKPAAPAPAAPSAPVDDWTWYAGAEVGVEPNVVYRQASGVDLMADIYTPGDAKGPTPTIMTMHGGGWVEGSRGFTVMSFLPYLERGFAVVNISYRLGRVAPAPAAVEDCRCALRWVIAHADQYHFDPKRIITMGWSAGGHLALTTGLMTVSAGFDATCPTDGEARWASGDQPEVKVAAIVNFFGITDVADLLDGPDVRHYAVEWLGSRSDRVDLAKRVSPLRYVRAGAPPVLSIHGDRDPYVPYSQAVSLHQALEAAHVPNRLVTVKGGGHGDWTRAQERDVHTAIFAFLSEHGLMPAAAGEKHAEAR